jgi:glycosyltransferase involved in cell wall biosynthesis
MIIEATQTRSPGNIELLIFLLNKIENKKIKTKVFLGHDYTFKILKSYNFESISIEKSSASKTIKRFLTRRKDVLFFCSYPPVVKNKNSLVYFHSAFFANPFKFLKDKDLSKKTMFSRIFVYYLIKFFNDNVDYFYCQTDAIETELKLRFKNIRVKKMPFFNDEELRNLNHTSVDKFNFDFFYPATPDVHKNFLKLFDAVQIVGQQRKIRLCITIDPKSKQYMYAIKKVNDFLKYQAIVNVGRVEKSKVLELFMVSRALIFPSLEESLGLPLIEAAFISCPIIGSDLPYIHDVVDNPIVFNQYDSYDIADKMTRFLDGAYNSITQKNKIKNNVGEIINYFS